MAIDDSQTIDIIATRPGSSVVELFIADHLDWDDFPAHALVLQAKLNTYIAFIESGQLAEQPAVSDIGSPSVGIVVAGLHEPSEDGKAFLARAKEFLEQAGIQFRFERRSNALH